MVAARFPTQGRPFLVSVGNLSLGGTGKTPVIMALAQDLAREGFRGAVLTRGYKSPLRGPVVVTPDLLLAGDEARLLSQALLPEGWIVVQARDRWAGVLHLRQLDVPLDFILLEDGHQTRKVGRDLDVVILDRWSASAQTGEAVIQPQAGPVFPFGPYRESAQGARRAGILLVESDVPHTLLGPEGQQVATFRRDSHWQKTRASRSARPEGSALAVVSGIARPEAFEQSVARLAGSSPRVGVRLQDHQAYGSRLARKLGHRLQTEGVTEMVTTAKDWIKLEPFWEGEIPVWISQLEIHWGQQSALPHLVREHALNMYPDLRERRF
jgi:tetraacyldisaccharide 4'-kinase